MQPWVRPSCTCTATCCRGWRCAALPHLLAQLAGHGAVEAEQYDGAQRHEVQQLRHDSVGMRAGARQECGPSQWRTPERPHPASRASGRAQRAGARLRLHASLEARLQPRRHAAARPRRAAQGGARPRSLPGQLASSRAAASPAHGPPFAGRHPRQQQHAHNRHRRGAHAHLVSAQPGVGGSDAT